LYAKAEKEFYDIVEKEKKLLEKKQAEKDIADKTDTGKVSQLISISYLRKYVIFKNIIKGTC